jgi:hypothetical protein
MSPDVVLLPVWGLVTSALVVLLLYHFSLAHGTGLRPAIQHGEPVAASRVCDERLRRP